MQLDGRLFGGCNEKRNAGGILSGDINRGQRGERKDPIGGVERTE